MSLLDAPAGLQADGSIGLSLYRPSSLDELGQVVAAFPGDELLVYAGGVEAVPTLRRSLAAPRALVDLKHLAELAGTTADPEELLVGACTTIDTLIKDTAETPWSWLGEVLGRTANVRVRARGTIGGNLEGASRIGDLRLAAALAGATWVSHELPTGSRHEDRLDAVRAERLLAHGRVGIALRIPRPGRGSAYGHCRYPARGALQSAAAVRVSAAPGRCAIAAGWVSHTAAPFAVVLEEDSPTRAQEVLRHRAAGLPATAVMMLGRAFEEALAVLEPDR